MDAARLSRRSFLAAGGVLIVGLGLDGLGRAPAQTVPGAPTASSARRWHRMRSTRSWPCTPTAR